jgi:anthranilate/para-aminobenzoate synthase component I
MPGASMTGVPKRTVNNWIRHNEPANINIYTGAIGYIASDGKSQFNTAVRTMFVKDQVAYIHSGRTITEDSEAEDIFYNTTININNLFDEIRGLREE